MAKPGLSDHHNRSAHPSRASHHKRARLLPVPVLAVIDVVLAGAALCVFSLFHHVLPSRGNQQGVEIPRPDTSSTAPTGGTTSSGENSGDSSPDNSLSLNGWAVKWPEKFSDTVEKTDHSYRSRDVSVDIQKVSEDGVTYFVADIYVSSIDNLKTAFAKDTYGRGYRESVEEMARRNNAVIAVNGDYYGTRDIGLVIRNGKLYRRELFEDVCVLFYDGTMQTYSSDQVNVDELVSKGAYQAWSFGPRLLDENGKAMTEFQSTVKPANPRTAIGYYEPGHYCMVLVEGRQENYSKGMRLETLSQLFESLGCRQAYNLDGGQSSVMAFDGKVYNQPYKGGRSSSDIFYIASLVE